MIEVQEKKGETSKTIKLMGIIAALTLILNTEDTNAQILQQLFNTPEPRQIEKFQKMIDQHPHKDQIRITHRNGFGTITFKKTNHERVGFRFQKRNGESGLIALTIENGKFTTRGSPSPNFPTVRKEVEDIITEILYTKDDKYQNPQKPSLEEKIKALEDEYNVNITIEKEHTEMKREKSHDLYREIKGRDPNANPLRYPQREVSIPK